MSKSIAVEVIATRILEISGKKVMLDRDLAKLYGVAVKVLNQAVKEIQNVSPVILCSNYPGKKQNL